MSSQKADPSSSSKEKEGQEPPFRIAIIGGGIGGLSTALLIHHFCSTTSHKNRKLEIDVYEQASAYGEIGAGIGIAINAAKLLHRIPPLIDPTTGAEVAPGVGDALNAAASPSSRGVWMLLLRYDTGEEITRITTPYDPESKIRSVQFPRCDLLQVLLEAIRARGAARLHVKKRFVRAEEVDKNEVRLSFQDGTSATANLVIGADGIHSSVRKQFTSSNKGVDNPQYSGKVVYRGCLPLPDPYPFSVPNVLWAGPGKHFLMYPIGTKGVLNVVACCTKDESEIPDMRESWSATCDRSELEADFADCEPRVLDVIKGMPLRPSKWRLNDRDPLPEWSFLEGKAILMGDAAHAMVPHQGAGAGQAIEDGYILGRALGDYLNEDFLEGTALKHWMDLYQRVRLPRAQKVQETSRHAGELFQVNAPDMLGKSYEESISILSECASKRMQWIWTEDIDDAYERMKLEVGLDAQLTT